MSHFTVAVFTEPNGASVDELMEPFFEELEVEPYVDCTKEELIIRAKERKKKIVADYQKGKELSSWEKPYLEADTDEELYACEKEDCYQYDKEGNQLSTYNPNSKWDWYSVGGRWAGLLKVKPGASGKKGERSWINIDKKYQENECDCAKVSDLCLDIDPQKYAKYERFWEIVVEDSPLKEDEKEENFQSVCNKKYYLKTYGDKKTFAEVSSQFSTYAVVTPDGRWHEKGEMGWFGISFETPKEALDWEKHYRERFLDTANPNWSITLLDCHNMEIKKEALDWEKHYRKRFLDTANLFLKKLELL